MAIDEAADAHIFFADSGEVANIIREHDSNLSNIACIVDRNVLRASPYDTEIPVPGIELTFKVADFQPEPVKGDCIEVGGESFYVQRPPVENDGVLMVVQVSKRNH